MTRTIVLLSLTLAVSSTRLFSQVIYVANTVSNDVSAYSVDAGSGALTAIPGSPFPAWPVPVAPFQDDVVGPAGVAKAYTVNAFFGQTQTLDLMGYQGRSPCLVRKTQIGLVQGPPRSV